MQVEHDENTNELHTIGQTNQIATSILVHIILLDHNNKDESDAPQREGTNLLLIKLTVLTDLSCRVLFFTLIGRI
jgi:hypothetical protein